MRSDLCSLALLAFCGTVDARRLADCPFSRTSGATCSLVDRCFFRTLSVSKQVIRDTYSSDPELVDVPCSCKDRQAAW